MSDFQIIYQSPNAVDDKWMRHGPIVSGCMAVIKGPQTHFLVHLGVDGSFATYANELPPVTLWGILEISERLVVKGESLIIAVLYASSLLEGFRYCPKDPWCKICAPILAEVLVLFVPESISGSLPKPRVRPCIGCKKCQPREVFYC